jgi:tetratricopeptide (TPR) repeat protein
VAGVDVWYDEQNLGAERLMATIEGEMRLRPIFIVVLSPEALASDWVRDECTWAYNLYRKDPERSRIILPVIARPLSSAEIWLFIEEFRRIADADDIPFTQQEAIRRVLSTLALTPQGEHGPTTTDESFTIGEIMDRGNALFAQRRPNEMLSIFEAATILSPTNSLAWTGKARARSFLVRQEQALEAAENAIRLDQRNAAAWNSKGGAGML